MTLVIIILLQVETVTRDERCIECHVDEGDAVKSSVHAQVGCIGCHGIDSIMASRPNPHLKIATFRGYRRQNIPEDCGACHQAELESMRPSGHFKSTKLGNAEPRAMDGCVGCHSHHDVKRAERAPLLETCMRCHAEEPQHVAPARSLFAEMDKLASKLGEDVARYDRRPGINARRLKDARAAASAALVDLRVAQHGVAFKELEAARARAAGSLDEAYNRLTSEERAFGRRWIWLTPFLALVVVSMVLVRLNSRRLSS